MDGFSWTAPAEAAAAAPLMVGQRVRVEGLVGRPDLNGRCGVATAYDAVRERYCVAIDDVPSPVLLRPGNLTAIGHASASASATGPPPWLVRPMAPMAPMAPPWSITSVPPPPPLSLWFVDAEKRSAAFQHLKQLDKRLQQRQGPRLAPFPSKAKPSVKPQPYTSPYHEFCREQRPLLPRGIKNADREKLIGQKWKQLTKAEKEAYEKGLTRFPSTGRGGLRAWSSAPAKVPAGAATVQADEARAETAVGTAAKTAAQTASVSLTTPAFSQAAAHASLQQEDTQVELHEPNTHPILTLSLHPNGHAA